ncbi:MAG TPA: hypothetical protein VHM31_13800 [Polyangia bacterium]|nr:hypothetical protein [Polyangia bacterium]
MKCFGGGVGNPDGRAYNLATVVLASQVPAANRAAGGGIECVDYPEQSFATNQPQANIQGSGNVAFPGCALGGTGHDACSDPATAP